MQTLTLERIGNVDIDRRRSRLLSAELWLWLELRALNLLYLWCGSSIVHIHVIEVVESGHLILRLSVKQWRARLLEVELRLCVMLLGSSHL